MLALYINIIVVRNIAGKKLSNVVEKKAFRMQKKNIARKTLEVIFVKSSNQNNKKTLSFQVIKS